MPRRRDPRQSTARGRRMLREIRRTRTRRMPTSSPTAALKETRASAVADTEAEEVTLVPTAKATTLRSPPTASISASPWPAARILTGSPATRRCTAPPFRAVLLRTTAGRIVLSRHHRLPTTRAAKPTAPKVTDRPLCTRVTHMIRLCTIPLLLWPPR